MRALLISHRPILGSIASGLGPGFECVGTNTIAEAWSLAGRAPIDLILLDLSSTGGQSFPAARDALPVAPMIVLSDHLDGDDALEAIAHGAQEVISPTEINTTALARVARFAIARHEAEERLRRVESRYRVLVDRLPTAAYTCDADGLITYFNPKAAELWGRSPRLNDPTERYCGSARLFSVDGDPVDHCDSWMARALREGVGFNGREGQLERADGERRHALVHANPIYDAHGRVIGAINVLVDITDQKRTAGRLQRKRELLQMTLDHAPVMVAHHDEDGRYTFVNRKMEQTLGWSAADFAARDLTHQVFGNDATRAQDCVNAADGHWADFRVCVRGGEIRETSWMTTRISDGTRISFGIDMTERRRAESAERERAALRQSIRAMDQVLGIVGHELRTPIAGLRAMTEFLLMPDATSSPEFGQFLTSMNAEAARMSDTVDNLLEAARLNSGRAKWNWGVVALADVCNEAADSVRPLIDTTRVALEIDIHPANALIAGDAGAIRRLVVNFLTNSRNHTTDGRITVSARPIVGQDGTRWVDLTVADTGEGIAPHMLGRLGEAFALNAGVVGDAHVRGSGLGLAICKGISAAHGGSIRVASTIGQGTVVTARLRADLSGPDASDQAAAPFDVQTSLAPGRVELTVRAPLEAA